MGCCCAMRYWQCGSNNWQSELLNCCNMQRTRQGEAGREQRAATASEVQMSAGCRSGGWISLLVGWAGDCRYRLRIADCGRCRSRSFSGSVRRNEKRFNGCSVCRGLAFDARAGGSSERTRQPEEQREREVKRAERTVVS